MEKCHCSNVRFDAVLELSLVKNLPVDQVAEECGVSSICTACKEDFLEFCKKKIVL
jgi:hypothetical protein